MMLCFAKCSVYVELPRVLRSTGFRLKMSSMSVIDFFHKTCSKVERLVMVKDLPKLGGFGWCHDALRKEIEG